MCVWGGGCGGIKWLPGTDLLVLQQLPADGDVPAGTQGLAAGPEVPQQARPLHLPLQGSHVQGSQVVLKQLVGVCRNKAVELDWQLELRMK